MTIIAYNIDFSICKLPDLSQVKGDCLYYFFAKTDEELSLVCPSDQLPSNAFPIENDWRLLRIAGKLDFSLVGILSRVTSVLAERKISVFAVSTFDTDYLLVKKDSFAAALKALADNGYDIMYK